MMTTNELVERLRAAKTVAEMTRLVIMLLNACGIFNYQQIGNELSRLSVTSPGLGPE